MVLLIIIPMENGYFIGNINPTFSGPNPDVRNVWSKVIWGFPIHGLRPKSSKASVLQVLEAVAESSTVAPSTEARGFPWKMQPSLEKERERENPYIYIYTHIYIYIYVNKWNSLGFGWVLITMPWTKNKEATYF